MQSLGTESGHQATWPSTLCKENGLHLLIQLARQQAHCQLGTGGLQKETPHEECRGGHCQWKEEEDHYCR
eukprot:5682026-Heterocapsa_arctica.AAC.1